MKNSHNFSIQTFNYFFWDFKPEIYKMFYPDVRHLNTLDLKKHYFNIGRFQRRIYNKGIKILIVCDPWNDNGQFSSGGNKALYNLGKLINEKKYKNIYAKMFVMTRENKHNPYCNFFAYENEVNPRTLVIYPDGNYGNPLYAKNVMRWILLEIGSTYRPMSILDTWGKNDLIYHWEPSHLTKNIKMLNNCTIDNSFKNLKLERNNKLSCFLIKKRTLVDNNISYIHPSDSICLDNLTKKEIINYLNICENFYCYDLKTFFIIGGIICGCKVILIPDNGTKQQYIEKSVFYKFPKINNFFAWGDQDISSITYNIDEYNEFLRYLYELPNSVNIFLEDIYNYFNNLPTNIPSVKSVYFS